MEKNRLIAKLLILLIIVLTFSQCTTTKIRKPSPVVETPKPEPKPERKPEPKPWPARIDGSSPVNKYDQHAARQPHKPEVKTIDPNSVVKEVVIQDTTLRRATLGFSYYKKIPMEETRDFRVNVVIHGSGSVVRSNIRKIEKDELQFINQHDTSSICFIDSIGAYSKLKVSLQCDPADFTITPFETEEEQILDFAKGNNWNWKVRAVSKTPHSASIAMIINAFTPDNVKIKLGIKEVNIGIVISLPKTIWSRIWDFVSDYFIKILGLIVTAAVPIYVGMIIKKKKRG